jgi:hypothetical protein
MWIKYFTNGSQLVGTDRDIAAGLISWSKTPTNLLSCSFEYDNFILNIVGPGEYWQSDTYESVYSNPAPKLIRRRIEKLIDSMDNYFRLIQKSDLLKVVFNSLKQEDGGKFIHIPSSWIGQWLIVEYDIKTKFSRYYLSENKI